MAATTAMPAYPKNTLASLLKSMSVTGPTRQALQERMARPPVESPRFFDEVAFAILQAACRRLIPPSDSQVQVDIASPIDSALADGLGDGWRYNAMPPDAVAYRLDLQGFDQTATAYFNASFTELDGSRQDSVLRAIQHGDAPGTAWQTVPGALCFEELLALAVEVYYAHPLVQESIGYAGMADAPVWQLIGLNQLEAREPRPVFTVTKPQWLKPLLHLPCAGTRWTNQSMR